MKRRILSVKAKRSAYLGPTFLVLLFVLILGLAETVDAQVIVSEEFVWKSKERTDHTCKSYSRTVKAPGIVSIRLKMNPFRLREFPTRKDDVIGHDLGLFGRYIGTTYNGSPKGSSESFLGKPVDRISKYRLEGQTFKLDFTVCNPVYCNFAGACSQPAAVATVLIEYLPDSIAKPADPPKASPPKMSAERLIFSTGNDGGVLNGGVRPAFTINVPVYITYIMTYHWNNGRGAPAGKISLRDTKGKVFGPWDVKVRNRVYWEISPGVTLPPGTYQVIDSDPSTWAQNSQSGGKGHVIIRGKVISN